MGKLIVSLSPHAHGTDTVERNMYGVIIALLPALVASFWFFGIGSVIVTATSVAACVLFEWAINKYMLRNERTTVCDGSAVLTGLLLAFNLPSNLPLWIIIIGALFAIGFAKMPFGGLGNNLFNPALVGRAALLVAFPAQMTTWPKVGQTFAYLDAETGATPLSIMKQAIKSGDASVLDRLPDSLSLFLGNHPDGAGAMGEICALALLLGLAYMLWKKIITWHIPVSIIVTVFVLAGLMHVVNPVYADPVSVVLSGGLMLGAIFMATDYVTSPMTHRGQLIYGVAIGALTVIIRNWGAYPEGMSFAILIMNAFTPLINNYVKPKRFGGGSQMKKLESSLLNMTLVLTAVTVIMGGILATVNDITSKPIAQQKEKALADGIKAVMGIDNLVVAETDTLSQTDSKGKEQLFVIYTIENNGQPYGAAVESTTGGFGGDLKVLVGFDEAGNILGYTLLEHAETPGLGAKADKWFQKGEKGNIIGKNPITPLTVSKDGGDVDAITASTITSRAFLKAVNNAYSAYMQNNKNIQNGASADAQTGATQQTKEK